MASCTRSWDSCSFRVSFIPIAYILLENRENRALKAARSWWLPTAINNCSSLSEPSLATLGAGEVVGFFNDYENLLGQCSFSGGCNGETIDQQYNGGSVWIYGVESLLSTQIAITEQFSLPILATYTLNQSSFRSDFFSSFHQFGSVSSGDALPYLATHQASLSLGIQTGKFTWGNNLSYRSKMLDAAGTFDSGELEIPELFLWESAVNVILPNRFVLYASGSNLRNNTSVTSWRPFGARTVAPRQIMLGVKRN